MPPPSHQTFAGPELRDLLVLPAQARLRPELAIPIPYHHSNLNSEEMIYYVDGNFSSRKGIEVGSVTLHPSGIPHGPQPGLAEKSIGMTETHELAVMCDTFHPLRLTKLAQGARRRQVRLLLVRGARLRARGDRHRRGSRRRHLALLSRDAVERQLEAYNAHDLTAFLACYYDYVVVEDAKGERDDEGRRRAAADVRAALPRPPGRRRRRSSTRRASASTSSRRSSSPGWARSRCAAVAVFHLDEEEGTIDHVRFIS